MSNSTGSDYNVVPFVLFHLGLHLIFFRGSYMDLIHCLQLQHCHPSTCVPRNSHCIFWIFLLNSLLWLVLVLLRVSYENAIGSNISAPISLDLNVFLSEDAQISWTPIIHGNVAAIDVSFFYTELWDTLWSFDDNKYPVCFFLYVKFCYQKTNHYKDIPSKNSHTNYKYLLNQLRSSLQNNYSKTCLPPPDAGNFNGNLQLKTISEKNR